MSPQQQQQQILILELDHIHHKVIFDAFNEALDSFR